MAEKTMRPLTELTAEELQTLSVVFCDIDDTITTDGRLSASAYQALERLQEAEIRVVPVTGRPAGWCDLIARLWPVDAVVGENGAFYFRYDRQQKKMVTRFVQDEAERRQNRARLEAIREEVLSSVEGAGIASDQPYRVSDLAIDFCEDVAPLSEDEVATIVAIFEKHGANAKVSSIHVNGWFGDFDKLSMTRTLAREWLDVDLSRDQSACLFVGDSPNDAPMFGFFENSVGVANVHRFRTRISTLPGFVTERESGDGFVELCGHLLAQLESSDS